MVKLLGKCSASDLNRIRFLFCRKCAKVVCGGVFLVERGAPGPAMPRQTALFALRGTALLFVCAQSVLFSKVDFVCPKVFCGSKSVAGNAFAIRDGL
jgi:hypothetical protein